MKTNKYAEKIRRRKESLKQNNTVLDFARHKSGLLLFVMIMQVLIIFLLIFSKHLLEGWPKIENLALSGFLFLTPFLFIFLWFWPKIYVKSLRNKSLGKGQSEFDREKERLKIEDDTRKTLAQIIGGMLFFLGLIFTFNTYRLNVEKQNLDREGQITERFTKAVSELGNDDVAVRLGGLYALERIAKDSPKDHWTIMEIISAYIREKSPATNMLEKDLNLDKNKGDISIEKKKLMNERVAADVQAAMTIIGRRKVQQDPPYHRIDLSRTNLNGVNLAYTNLANINFAQSNLSCLPDLSKSIANFGDCVNLTGANLSNATLFNANLIGANLEGAILDYARFDGAAVGSYIFGKEQIVLIVVGGVGGRTKLIDIEKQTTGYYRDQASGLSIGQISNAIISEYTYLPENLELQRENLLEISKKYLEEIEGKKISEASQ